MLIIAFLVLQVNPPSQAALDLIQAQKEKALLASQLSEEKKARLLAEEQRNKEAKSVDHVVEKSISQFFQSASDRLKQMGSGRGAGLDSVLDDIKTKMAADGISVTVDDSTGTLSLPEEVLFQSGSADLRITPNGNHAMDVLARELRVLLPCHVQNLAASGNQTCPDKIEKFDTVLIEGHADHIRLGSKLLKKYGSNLNLSSARAAAVYEAIVAREPDIGTALSGNSGKAGAGQHLIGVVGYGDTRPDSQAEAVDDKRLRGIDLRFIVSAKQ